jgi:hypothetical protein
MIFSDRDEQLVKSLFGSGTDRYDLLILFCRKAGYSNVQSYLRALRREGLQPRRLFHYAPRR